MKLEIKNRTAFLDSRPTPRLLAVLRGLEGQRRWIKDGGLQLEASEYNIDCLRESFPEIVVCRGSGGPGLAQEFGLGGRPYASKTRPYGHQIRALEKARTRSAFALFMEQGTGKTKIAIDRAGELFAAGEITGTLVVAKKGVHRQWIESQLPEHFGAGWSGAYWQDSKFIEVRSGDGLVWRSINFDGAKVPKGKVACLEFIRAHAGRVLIIADETQEIKNPRSARHLAMEELKRAQSVPFRLALTGTPIARDLSDEWAQLKWLDERILGMRYVTAFRAEYCIMGGYEGREVIGHKNLERFRQKVDAASFRATKDELGILPKAYRRWQFDLSGEQKRVIRSIRQDLIARIDSGEVVSAATAAVAIVKVQQASNGFVVDEGGTPRDLGTNPRILALLEVLEAVPGKTIVWARFRRDIELIARALKDAGISFVEYHGGTPDNERAANVCAFLDPEGPRVFLSNPQAGGTGLNLQGGCRHAVYYSNSFNAIDRWQSEDRIHRIGTTGVVSYTDLVAKGSVDAGILANLRRKKGISDLALGDIKELFDEIV